MSQTSPINISSESNSQPNYGSRCEMGSSPSTPSDYARIMLEHTKRQLSTATSSARRRSQGLDSSPSSPTSSVSSSTAGS